MFRVGDVLRLVDQGDASRRFLVTRVNKSTDVNSYTVDVTESKDGFVQKFPQCSNRSFVLVGPKYKRNLPEWF